MDSKSQPAPRADIDPKLLEKVMTEDEATRRSLVKLQKELRQAKTLVAKQRRLVATKALGSAVRGELDKLSGVELTQTLAKIAPASEEEQVKCSERC